MQRIRKFLGRLGAAVVRAGRVAVDVLFFSLADRRISHAKTVVISIEADGIHLVYSEKSFRRVRIRQCHYEPLADGKPPSPDRLCARVSGFVADHAISGASFILSIPRDWAIVERVRLPKAAGENLSRVLSLELDRLTPLARDQALHSWCLVGEDEDGVTVMLAAVPLERVWCYLDALAAREAGTTKLVIGTFMIRNLITRNWPKSDAVFVSWRHGVFECGAIVDSRLTASSLERVEGKDEATSSSVREALDQLAGAFTAAGRLRILFIDADEAYVPIARNAFPSFDVVGPEDCKEPLLGNDAGNMSAATLGGSLDPLCDEFLGVNLLDRGVPDRCRPPVAASLILVVGIIVLLAVHFLVPLYVVEERIEQTDRLIQSLGPDVKKAEALQTRIDGLEQEIGILSRFREQEPSSLGVLKDLTSLVPRTTWLTRLRIGEMGSEMEGYASSASEVVLALEKTKLFRRVEFAAPTVRDPRLRQEHFALRMEWRTAGAAAGSGEEDAHAPKP